MTDPDADQPAATPTAHPTPDTLAPLLIGGTPGLVADLTILATQAGAHLTAAADANPEAWRAAPVVLVALDALAACIRADLPHRPDVIVIVNAGRELIDVWTPAEAIGAAHVLHWPACRTWLAHQLTTNPRTTNDHPPTQAPATTTGTPLVAFRPQNNGVHPLVAAGIDPDSVHSVTEHGARSSDGTWRNLTQFHPAHAVFRPRLHHDDHPDRRRYVAPHTGKTVVGVIDHGPSALYPGERQLGVVFTDARTCWAASGELHGLTVDPDAIAATR